MKRLNLFIMLLAALLPAGRVHAAATTLEDTWYVVRFQGHHAGWMHQLTRREGDLITESSEVQITIQRGPAVVEIGMTTGFVETAGGKALSASAVQRFAGQAIEKTVTFSDEALTVTSKQFGQSHTQKLPPVGTDWLTPAAAQRYVARQSKAGEKTVKFRTFDPSASLEPFEVTVETIGPKDIEVYGKVVPAVERTVVMSILPTMKTVEFDDEEGRLLKSTVDVGGMQMEMVRADKKLAMAKADPPEMLVATLIKPGFALLNPRKMRKAAFTLEVKEGKMVMLPQSAVQRVERVDERTSIVRIDIDRAPEVEKALAPPTVTHNVMINGGDELIVKLTKQATAKAGAAPAQKAEAIRRFVHQYIRTSDLSVGMASASEVARTKVGDCTEHAVLLAAMLKAAGIPAKFASGLIYVDDFVGKQQVFGYHAWAQGWIDGRWLDLDATLSTDTPFDATHILLNVSDLADAAMANDMVDLLPLMGNLTIRLAE